MAVGGDRVTAAVLIIGDEILPDTSLCMVWISRKPVSFLM